MTQPKSFTLDGRRYRIDPMVPMAGIERWVAKRHVDTADDELTAELRAGAGHDPVGWSPRLIKQACRWAVACHRRNQELYRYVRCGARRGT